MPLPTQPDGVAGRASEPSRVEPGWVEKTLMPPGSAASQMLSWSPKLPGRWCWAELSR